MEEGMGRRFRRAGTYVYLWLIHVDVCQKQTQHCETIIIQLKIKFKNLNLINKPVFNKYTNLLLFFSCLVMSDSSQPHWLQHTRLPYPSPFPGVCTSSCPLSQWCHLLISSYVSPSPPALNLSQTQGLFQWLSSSCQVARELKLQLQHQSFWWIFRLDFL